MTRRTNQGFTVTEVVLAMGLGLTLMVILGAYQHAALRAGRSSMEEAEALRSILVASETIRDDLGRMVCHDPSADVAIIDSGRGFSFRSADTGSDLVRGHAQVVTYSLLAIPGSVFGYRLVRQDEHTKRVLAGCLLRDMVVTSIVSGFRDPGRLYLEFTLVGLDSRVTGNTPMETFLVPIHVQPTIEKTDANPGAA